MQHQILLCQIARNEYISYTRKKHRTDQELTEQAYSDGKRMDPNNVCFGRTKP